MTTIHYETDYLDKALVFTCSQFYNYISQSIVIASFVDLTYYTNIFIYYIYLFTSMHCSQDSQ